MAQAKTGEEWVSYLVGLGMIEERARQAAMTIVLEIERTRVQQCEEDHRLLLGASVREVHGCLHLWEHFTDEADKCHHCGTLRG